MRPEIVHLVKRSGEGYTKTGFAIVTRTNASIYADLTNISRFSPNVTYDSHSIVTVGGVLFYTPLKREPGFFNAEDWEEIDGRFAILTDWKIGTPYTPSSVLIGPDDVLYMSLMGTPVMIWEEAKETLVPLYPSLHVMQRFAYMDPTTDQEQATIIDGHIVEIDI